MYQDYYPSAYTQYFLIFLSIIGKIICSRASSSPEPSNAPPPPFRRDKTPSAVHFLAISTKETTHRNATEKLQEIVVSNEEYTETVGIIRSVHVVLFHQISALLWAVTWAGSILERYVRKFHSSLNALLYGAKNSKYLKTVGKGFGRSIARTRMPTYCWFSHSGSHLGKEDEERR